MSLLWVKDGNLLTNADGSLALVRAWIYNKAYNCGSLPATITIIGCEPPLCVKFKNTNLNPSWWPYERATCGPWGGSGGYAWPDDVPGCPLPDGFFLEETINEDCNLGEHPDLKINIEGTLCNYWRSWCNWYDQWGNWWATWSNFICEPDPNPPVWPTPPPTSSCGSAGRVTHWDASIMCGDMICIPGGDMVKDGTGWKYTHSAVITLGCDGSVGFELTDGIYWWGGTGTPIELNAEYLPIGISTIPVYGVPTWGDPYAGTLTITVSKV